MSSELSEMDLITYEMRQREFMKYTEAYQKPGYAMGPSRKKDAQADLLALPCRGKYLDVGCGRGEMLTYALSIGFSRVQGFEVVIDLIDADTKVSYSECHNLKCEDKEFDISSMFDVLEHLVPGDDQLACKELARVTKSHILLTANNKDSKLADDTQLHINKRPYEEWDSLFREWFAGAKKVVWLKSHKYVSEGWRIDL